MFFPDCTSLKFLVFFQYLHHLFKELEISRGGGGREKDGRSNPSSGAASSPALQKEEAHTFEEGAKPDSPGVDVMHSLFRNPGQYV